MTGTHENPREALQKLARIADSLALRAISAAASSPGAHPPRLSLPAHRSFRPRRPRCARLRARRIVLCAWRLEQVQRDDQRSRTRLARLSAPRLARAV